MHPQTEPAFQVDGKFNEQARAGAPRADRRLRPTRSDADMRSTCRTRAAARVAAVRLPARRRARARSSRSRTSSAKCATRCCRRRSSPPRPTVDDAAVAGLLRGATRRDYQTPESVRLQYAELRLEQIAAAGQVAETICRTSTSKNRDRYVDPEKRRARHILINIEAGKDAAARSRPRRSLAEARKPGEDFAALAQQVFEGRRFGRAGRRSRLVRAQRLRRAVRGRAVRDEGRRDRAARCKTEFGYHVIRLEGIQAGHGSSFDEARAELEAEFRRDRAADLFGETQEQAQRSSRTPTRTSPRWRSELGLSTGEVAEFTPRPPAARRSAATRPGRSRCSAMPC